MTSYSVAPLKIATHMGLGVSALSLLYELFVIWKSIFLAMWLKDIPH